jgi:hypothetical protein
MSDEQSRYDDEMRARAEQARTDQQFAQARSVNPRDLDPDERRSDARVFLRRGEIDPIPQEAFWTVIRNRTIDFLQYKRFVDGVMCCLCDPLYGRDDLKKEQRLDLRLPFPGVRAYNLLKLSTELYLMHECGLVWSERDYRASPGLGQTVDGKPCVTARGEFEERLDAGNEAGRTGRPLPSADEILTAYREDYLDKLLFDTAQGPQSAYVLPYLKVIREKLADIPIKDPRAVPPNCYGILPSKFTGACLLELIWSYWHEEGMLVQTMNAISRRFQNVRSPAAPDPLGALEIDPLRPLNNLLWSHIQDEQHRLSITRRTYEYDHHYGLRLVGRAVAELRSADPRSKFLEAFHQLLHACTVFFQQDDDTTVISDGFPILNALREVHIILAFGAHNQFGDLPSTSRIEMLIEMWLLSRPEIREFLRGRIMVPYPEPWMDAVDHMKTIQRWTDTSVRDFRDLAVFGEQLLLSIRYDNWSVYNNPDIARAWARNWRPEIQRYIHAYRAATGVDLHLEPVDATLPATLLQRRLSAQVQAIR